MVEGLFIDGVFVSLPPGPSFSFFLEKEFYVIRKRVFFGMRWVRKCCQLIRHHFNTSVLVHINMGFPYSKPGVGLVSVTGQDYCVAPI